jgi:N-acyl amino acid synthase of PEP-CTERM/exosortase system
METTTSSLASNFLQYFDVSLATTDEQKEAVYGIRYSVYCNEFRYESTANFPNQMESDAYDSHSLHCLVTHKGSGLPAGCVRLVATQGPRRDHPLPFEKFCPDSLDDDYIDGLKLSRNAMCEISRLAVDGPFRRRAGEEVTRFGEVEGLDCTQQERRTFAVIAVACFLAATAMTALTDRTSVFAMMEPFLPRLMKRSGITFTRAGSDVDYHGLRAPYFIKTGSALTTMRPDLRELYEAIYVRMAKDYAGAS